jgi:undecaprenyl-phosphate 4-deoxy-4-formamido-L-arabinose transferase
LSRDKIETPAVELSVVIPVYDEEAVLPMLFDRLYPVLDGLGIGYEAVFVDDGSRDRSATLLRQQHKLRPDVTRVLLLRGDAGQHAAIMAGFDASTGGRLVTLDADLQNPPEEIPRLLAEMDRGHDYVGGVRRQRRSSRWRDWALKAMSRLREQITRVRMTDQGCMLRAYDREVVDAVLASQEAHPCIPALAYLYAVNPTEIEVDHDERAAGESKHPFYRPVHLDLDLITGLTLAPLRIFSLVSIGISLAAFVLVIFLAFRRLIVGPEVEGLFTLFCVLFFLLGVILFGIGLLGQYVGRVYEQSRGRPSYLVRAHLRPGSDQEDPGR